MAPLRADEWPDGGADQASREPAVEAALEALVPAGKAGAPAWADVLTRAAGLRACACSHRRDDGD